MFKTILINTVARINLVVCDVIYGYSNANRLGVASLWTSKVSWYGVSRDTAFYKQEAFDETARVVDLKHIASNVRVII